jgi:sporulation protein YlmC with PRC-barrel domain
MPTSSGQTAAICASDVIGTDVFQTSGEKIGHVEDIVLDKTTNRIMFAIVSFGGALTTSANYYPLPWSVLDYVGEAGGFVVPYTKEQIAGGPVNLISELVQNDGAGPRNAAYKHYKVAQDW